MPGRILRCALLMSLLAPACSSGRDELAPAARMDPGAIREIGINALEQRLAQGQCTVLDANQANVRARHGTIPGATLLTHYENYKLAELPADKAWPLVFYCANQSCRASDKAAERALLAGYTDVRVLRDGIMGWARAGKRVAQP